MDQLLLPLSPTSPLAKVPYVGKERYDGLPFLGYAKRKGKFNYGEPSPDIIVIDREARRGDYPSPPEEQEPFFQTWLFFGLLSEVFQGNSTGDSQATSGGPNEKIDSIYTNYVYEEGGKKYVTTAPFLPPVEALVAALGNELDGVEKRKSRFKHLALCIRYAGAVFSTCSNIFNPEIRLSIAAMGESLMWIVSNGLDELKMEQSAFSTWARGCLTPQMQTQMLQHGWCQSDVAKCLNNFNSVQALHLFSKIDKSQPGRSHAACTNQVCSAGQIDMSNYNVDHVKEDCHCEYFTIDENLVVEILKKKDRFPVLRIWGEKSDLSDFRVDILESDVNTSFAAISHVWVDGLGNPFANSLHRCQLVQLRDLVYGIKEFAPKKGCEANSALLWLDTLCCPVRPWSAKMMAIEKIRNVYMEATCVLVLDADLRSYYAMSMSIYEVFARIATSGWTKRLWTLQEGALAKSLLFQFADQCVSLDFLYNAINLRYKTRFCQRGLHFAVKMETDLIRSFFYSERYTGFPVHLPLLGMALQNRSVTVPTDEPLCISTLLSLDMPPVLAVSPDERMPVVWEQLVASKVGVAAAIIFFTDRRLDVPGFRWAPKTLLGASKEGVDPNERSSFSKPTIAEGLTKGGLHVRFGGFKLKQRSYNDGLPHDPWWGSLKNGKTGQPTRAPESFVEFRDGENNWFRFYKQETSTDGRIDFSDEDREWKPNMEYPLYDISATGRCAILLHGNPTRKVFRGNVGLIVSYRDGSIAEKAENALSGASGIHVRSEGHILVHTCSHSEKLMLSTCERIATQLRSGDLTRKLCGIQDQKGEEYQRLMDELRAEMKRLTKDALESDPKLVDAINTNHNDFLDHVWKFVANWYRQDVFVAERLPDDQLWIVD